LEIERFNKFSGTLEIELTRPPEKIPNTGCFRGAADAKIKSLALTVTTEIADQPKYAERALTSQELLSVGFRGAQIQLRGRAGITVLHNAPNGEYFTVEELFDAVEITEQRTRGESEWFGGIDIHHIFFAGIHQASDGVWEIHWDS